MSIYKDLILDHYRHPRNFGSLKKRTSTVFVTNPLCGDEIKLDVLIQKDRIIGIKFDAQGCAISIASASLLSEYVKNKSTEELHKLDSAFIIKLLGITLSPNRIKCALLPLEALTKIINSLK